MNDKIVINYNWLFGFATVTCKDKSITVNGGPNFDKGIEVAENELRRLFQKNS